MEWNGMEWNGMEWNGMEWNGMEWNGMEWNGIPNIHLLCVIHQRFLCLLHFMMEIIFIDFNL
jgi:hypothetical protein